MTVVLPLMMNELEPLAKSVWIPLGLTAAESAAEAVIGTNVVGFGDSSSKQTRTLIISIEEMEDNMKIVKSIEDSGLLIKSVNQTTKNKTRELNGTFCGMLFGTLGASLLQYMLVGKGVGVAVKGTTAKRTRSNLSNRGNNLSRTEFLMMPHPLTNFKIQISFQNDVQLSSKNESRLNVAYSRND